MESSALAVQIESSESTANGVINVNTYSLFDRFKRTSTVGSIGILLTVLCVFIPVLHFILVPSGLMATIAIMIMTAVRVREISGGKINCPQCTSEVKLEKQRLVLPLELFCPKCFGLIRLRKRAI